MSRKSWAFGASCGLTYLCLVALTDLPPWNLIVTAILGPLAVLAFLDAARDR